jgi:hypothetical protein
MAAARHALDGNLERVTRIELALSAWEAVPLVPFNPVTCGEQ